MSAPFGAETPPPRTGALMCKEMAGAPMIRKELLWVSQLFVIVIKTPNKNNLVKE